MLPSLDLQERDLSILRGLFECRVMTAAHIAALHFNDSKGAAKNRLQKLKVAALIGERRRRVYEPSILFLTKAAFQLLKEHGVTNEYPAIEWAQLERRVAVSDLTLRHELLVMDVKAAFTSAARKTAHLTVKEFTTWPYLIQFRAKPRGGAEILTKPDGFIRIHEQSANGSSEHTFFLEVDRSTETLDTLATKAACYLSYYQSGEFAIRCGGVSTDYKAYPFRVLIVCKSKERGENAAKRLLQNNPPILTQCMFATLSETCAQPLAAIWSTPAKPLERMTLL